MRNICDVESEIIDQILISETCFDVCKEIPILSGRGSDFLPFYYNLSLSKGILLLNSLLVTPRDDELSIRYFLNLYKQTHPAKDLKEIEAKIDTLRLSFKTMYPVSLRHKMVAHLDDKFKHGDFTCAYLVPESLEKFREITKDLKEVIFTITNFSIDYPHHANIMRQTKIIVEQILKESEERLSL